MRVKLTTRISNLTGRDLFVLQLSASLGVGSGGLAGDPMRPSGTSFFHLSVQPSSEYKSSFSWLSLYGYGMAYCPSRHSVQILRGRGVMVKGEVHASPACPLGNPIPICYIQWFLRIAHGAELCQMGEWEDEIFIWAHFSSKQNQSFMVKKNR